MKRAMNNSVHLLSIFKLIGFVLYSVFIVDELPASLSGLAFNILAIVVVLAFGTLVL